MLQCQQVAPSGGSRQAASLSDFAGGQAVMVGIETGNHIQAVFQAGDPVASLQNVPRRIGVGRFRQGL
jgi:hypothetical protein